MRATVLATALASVLGTYAGFAAAQQSYGDVARVISATPISQTVTESRRDCRVEQVNEVQERRTVVGQPPTGAGAVLGSILGGVIGYQFGYHGGGAAAGAVVGSMVGNSGEVANTPVPEVYVDRTPVARDIERCRYIPETRDKVVAFDVRYEYNGHEFQVRMPYDPGPEMPVNVEVRPPAATRSAAWGAPPPPSYRRNY